MIKRALKAARILRSVFASWTRFEDIAGRAKLGSWKYLRAASEFPRPCWMTPAKKVVHRRWLCRTSGCSFVLAWTVASRYTCELFQLPRLQCRKVRKRLRFQSTVRHHSIRCSAAASDCDSGVMSGVSRLEGSKLSANDYYVQMIARYDRLASYDRLAFR